MTRQCVSASTALTCLLVAAVAFGCSNERDRGATDAIVVGITRLPDRVAPLNAPLLSEESLVSSMLFSGLFQLTDDSNALVVRVSLASDWPVPLSEDLAEFSVQLRADARWSDGTPVTANDVELSWRVLNDDQNDYPRRAILLAHIRSMSRGECERCVRISTVQSMTPDDLAWLLTFPLLAAHAVHLQHETDIARLVSGGSDSNAWVDNLSGHPVGSGDFVLEGSLDAQTAVAAFRRLSSGSTFVFRALPTAAAQQAAVDNDELDVLIEPDSGLVLPGASRLKRVESNRETRVSLVLNPGIERWSKSQDRLAFLQRVSALLATGRAPECKARVTPANAVFRVLFPESGPLVTTAIMRLRAALRCLGRALVVSRHWGRGDDGRFLRHDAVLVSIGDEGSDVSRVARLLANAGVSGYQGATAAYDKWMQTPARLGRDSMRERFFGALTDENAMTVIQTRRRAILVRSGVAGFRLGADGGIQVPGGAH